jgi:FHS family glucose/mannose:H+ symporter-like MFS transporter
VNRSTEPSGVSFAVLTAAFVLNGMVTTLLGPVLPWLTLKWTLSDAAAGALFTAQFAGGFSGGLASGALVARLGDARTLALGYGLMTVGLLTVAAGTYQLAILGVCAAGLGVGFASPTTNLLVARLQQHRAASALGAINFAWGIGAVAWPMVVAAAARAWTPVLALVALGGTILIVTAPILRAAVRQIRYPGSPADPARRVASSASSLSRVRVALFASLITLYTGVESALGGWLPEYVRRLTEGRGPLRWAAVGTVFWAALTAGRGLIAVRLPRHRESAAAVVGLGMVATSIVLVLRARTEADVLVAAVIGGLGLAPIFPVTVAALAAEVPITVAGPVIACGSLGAATIPWVVGVISDYAESLAVGMASLLGFTLVALGLQLVRMSTRPGQGQSPGTGTGASPR